MKIEINPYEWVLVERRMPIVIGIGEGVLGLLLVAIASSAIPLILPQWLPPALLSNLGIGLLAAGITTGTLEPISRRRMQRDVREIKEAHFESTLKGFMPEPIFEKVKAHIIRQPFLREDFRWSIELKWMDEDREYLHRSSIGSYKVKNTSRTPASYELLVLVERGNEERFPGSTHIREIQVQRDGEQPRIYTKPDLEKFLEKTDQYIKVTMPLMLEPGEWARVRAYAENVLLARDVYLLTVGMLTNQFELMVTHPDDLSVRAMPMHPSQHKFVGEVGTTYKRWRIEAGLLPFQGIEVSWCPFSPTTEGEEG